MSRHRLLGSLGVILAEAFMASARSHALAQPVLAARNLVPEIPPLGHEGRRHFQAVREGHDFQVKRHRGPNPKGPKPRFNRHSYF